MCEIARPAPAALDNQAAGGRLHYRHYLHQLVASLSDGTCVCHDELSDVSASASSEARKARTCSRSQIRTEPLV
eukprot:4876544-Prymnesium_polylepis.1